MFRRLGDPLFRGGLQTPLGVKRVEENQLLDYSFNDQFDTDDAAPVTKPLPTDPGPGQWTVVDTGDKFSVSSSLLEVASQTSNWSDPRVYEGTFTREAGLVIYRRVNITVNANKRFAIGTSNNPGAGGTGIEAGLRAFGTSGLAIAEATAPILHPHQAWQEMITVLKATGAYEFAYDGTDWLLVWPRYAGSSASLYHIIDSTTPAGNSVDTVRRAPLPAFADSSFITDSIAGALSAGQTFTHEADGWISYLVGTLPSSGTHSVYVRWDGATSFYEIEIASDGSIDVLEDGSVSRIAGGAGSVANGNRIRWMAEGSDSQLWVNNTSIGTYASTLYTSNAQGKVNAVGTGGALSDLEALPRTASGSHLTNLQAIAAGT